MTNFESEVKTIGHPAGKVYGFLSDFDNFGTLIPSDKISNWQSFGDRCSFEVDGLGEVGLSIISKEPDRQIKYSADGSVPFNFYLWVDITSLDENQCQVKLTLEADLNPMMKMMAEGPLQQFLDMLADGIAGHSY
ncbi:MAG: SRPBCC family protein [Bacteroidota bacterium]